MWHWVTSSSRAASGIGRALVALAAVAACLAAAPPAAGTVLMTADEALALAYPGCEVERTTVYLSEAQREAAVRQSGVEVRSLLLHPYRARCGGRDGGTAYFDVHRVRTLEETVMVALDADGAVSRVEVLSFREPVEYIPREIWYQQFDGRRLDAELRLKRGIRGVTGATLTARATTEAVRRVLALHAVVGAGAGEVAR